MSIHGSVTEIIPRKNNFQIVYIGASLPLHHPVEWVWWVTTHCLPPPRHFAVMDWIRRFTKQTNSRSTAIKQTCQTEYTHNPPLIKSLSFWSNMRVSVTTTCEEKNCQLPSELRDHSFLALTSADHNRMSQSLEHMQALMIVLHGRIKIRFPFDNDVSECFSVLDPSFNHCG